MAATDRQGLKKETPTKAPKQEAERPCNTTKPPTEQSSVESESIESESIVTAHIDSNYANQESLQPDTLNTETKSSEKDRESSHEQMINIHTEKDNFPSLKEHVSAKDGNATSNKAGSTSPGFLTNNKKSIYMT